MNGVNGMGDMFEYPTQEGVSPGQFYEQQIAAGSMPLPQQGSPAAGDLPWGAATMEPMAVEPQPMQFPVVAQQREGSMSWEAGPAPWEQAPEGPPAAPALSPMAAPAAAESVHQQEARAVQAAQAAKVAADNAVRAAKVGAPKVAATNAATAQTAANVAAMSAKTPRAQKAAAIAQNEATKAVAAANVAAQNGGLAGMSDWMELSGLGNCQGMGCAGATDFLAKYKWYFVTGAALLGGAYYAKAKGWI